MRRKCKVCKAPAKYVTCDNKAHCGNPECVLELHQQMREKRITQKIKERKERLRNTVPYWTKKAQAEFNKYIRNRDQHLPCVSCGREITLKRNAGHYRTVGANPELRFCELNVHMQCEACNNFKSGNLVEYRIELARRIGATQLEWLEGPHEPKHYRVEDLKEIYQKYKALNNEYR